MNTNLRDAIAHATQTYLDLDRLATDGALNAADRALAGDALEGCQSILNKLWHIEAGRRKAALVDAMRGKPDALYDRLLAGKGAA